MGVMKRCIALFFMSRFLSKEFVQTGDEYVLELRTFGGEGG